MAIKGTGGDFVKINTTAIKAAIAEKGMTQRETAEKAGIAQPQFSTMLARGTATCKSAGRIAAALEVPVAAILEP